MMYENAIDIMYPTILQSMTLEELKASQKMTELYNKAVNKTCALREVYLFGGWSNTTIQKYQIWYETCDDMLKYAYSHGWIAHQSGGYPIAPGTYMVVAFIPTRLINKRTKN